MKDIALFGAGGFGREVACLIRLINESLNEPRWNLIGFFDDNADLKGTINEYGEILPPEKMIKVEGLLDPSNIAFTASKDQKDFQADSELGKLIINPIKTSGDSIEEKIVTSMGSIIHETFHLMINMLKDPKRAEQLGERLMYKVATTEGDKELHFAPGKYGQVLSEGFVEKLSTEFARRNGFYHVSDCCRKIRNI